MKPHLDIQQEGDLGDADRVDMTFDTASTGFLMRILTDLYPDAELATVREYATNALDSHIEAGNPEPIRVYLPTPLAPTFRVVDFGTGMSRETIEQVYSKYGASTKRNTDTQSGMLGLGCKAGLAYASQFTLISCHQGTRLVVLVSRRDDGTGTLQIISEEPTDEPNGVEIAVPVSNSRSIIEKTIEHFRYWEPGTVLINDEPPKYCVWTDEHTNVLDPDVVLYPDSSYGALDQIVMGNIAYPIPSAWRGNLRHGNGWVFVGRVPMGSVDFTPARDGLQDTKRSREAVTALYEFSRGVIHQRAQAEIDAATTHVEAVKLHVKWGDSFFGLNDLTYKGARIPDWIKPGKGPAHYEKVEEIRPGRRNLRSVSTEEYGPPVFETYVNQVRIDHTADEQNLVYEWFSQRGITRTADTREQVRLREAVEYLHVVGYPRMGLRVEAKAKILLYLQQQGLTSVTHVLCYKHAFGTPWFDDTPTVSWDTVKAIKLPGDGSNPRKRVTQWRWYAPQEELVDELPTDKTIIWLSADLRWEDYEYAGLASFLGDDFALVVVPKNRQQKLAREYPMAVAGPPVLFALAENMAKNFDSADAFFMTADFNHKEHALAENAVKPQNILDPNLRLVVQEMRAAAQRESKIQDRWTSLHDFLTRLGPEGHEVKKTVMLLAQDAAEPFKSNFLGAFNKYPLIAPYNHYRRSDLGKPDQRVEYVNAMYLVRESLHLDRVY